MTFEQYKRSFEVKAIKAGYSADSIAKCLTYAKPIIVQNLPVIYNTANLAALVGYNRSYIKRAVSYTNYYYRYFLIKKTNGTSRRLSEPLPSLKEIQHWILDNVLYQIPTSKFAKAYIPSRELLDNIKYHRNKEVVVCLDIKDFFGSIKNSSVETIFRKIGYSSNVSNLLGKLCCLNGSLPQGAPTSPYLSNLYMTDFDEIIGNFCKPKDIRFTRYADDMTFSGNFDPSDLILFVKKQLEVKNLIINEKKTKIMRNGSRQIVTGVVVNKKLQVPKYKREKIRQEIYYIKKFGLIEHLKQTENIRANYIRHLMGKINFVIYINPKDQEMIDYLAFLKTLL